MDRGRSSGETYNAILDHFMQENQRQQKQKGFDMISMLTASIANRMRNNWSSCVIFPRVLPQLSRNTKGKRSF